MNIRKRGYWFAALLTATFALPSCTTNEDANEENIVSSNYIVVASATSMTANTPTAIISVTSNCHWQVTVDKSSWSDLNVSPLEGTGNGSVIIETTVNNTEGDRAAVLTFTNDDGTLTRTNTLTQSAGDFQATLSLEGLEQIDLSYEELTRDVTVVCNTSWTTEVEIAGGGTWCTLLNGEGTGNGKFSVVITDNQSASARTANLKVTTKNRSGNPVNVTVPITQSGAPMPDATVEATLASDGVTVSITGKVYSRSKYNLTDYGYCISRSPQPRDHVSVMSGGSSVEGDINVSTELEDGYTYYICTYAQSTIGTTYSADYSITLPGSTPSNNDNTSPSLIRNK